mgnify:CR=1 FL=1
MGEFTQHDDAEEDRRRVLVAGSTGYLGRHLVKALHAQGHWVRALVRDPSRLGEAAAAVDEVFVGQATDDATLAGVAEGVDAVISCLGNRTFKRRPSVWEVDRDANVNLVRRSREVNVSRFVFVSVLGGRCAPLGVCGWGSWAPDLCTYCGGGALHTCACAIGGAAGRPAQQKVGCSRPSSREPRSSQERPRPSPPLGGRAERGAWARGGGSRGSSGSWIPAFPRR